MTKAWRKTLICANISKCLGCQGTLYIGTYQSFSPCLCHLLCGIPIVLNQQLRMNQPRYCGILVYFLRVITLAIGLTLYSLIIIRRILCLLQYPVLLTSLCYQRQRPLFYVSNGCPCNSYCNWSHRSDVNTSTDTEINQKGGQLRFKMGLSYIVSITIAEKLLLKIRIKWGIYGVFAQLSTLIMLARGLGHPSKNCTPEIESGSSFD